MRNERPVALCFVLVASIMLIFSCAGGSQDQTAENKDTNTHTYLPAGSIPRLYVPRHEFSSDPRWQRTTPFWFGTLGSSGVSVECRAAWTSVGLVLRVVSLDRHIYDEAGADDDWSRWDAVTLLVDTQTDSTAPDRTSRRLVVQARRHGTERNRWYVGQGGAWVPAEIPFSPLSTVQAASVGLEKGYRGEGRDDSRGWHVVMSLGWEALGIAPPASSPVTLRVGLIVHDRDDLEGLRVQEARWPTEALSEDDPQSWGLLELIPLSFADWDASGASSSKSGAAYAIGQEPEPFIPGTERTLTLRTGVGDLSVQNASVGASGILCSGDDDYNFGDGPDSFGGETRREYFHVQNQADYADWPCFARAYVRFPLNLPPEAAVVSARLVLHHKQPTGGGDEGDRSLIHAFWTSPLLRGGATLWTTGNLTWNSAPLPLENLSGAWGNRTGVMETGWDNLPEWSWEVTRAVRFARREGTISFALFSSDDEYHTGKEFVRSEDFPDWGNPSFRPTLEIVLADPAAR